MQCFTDNRLDSDNLVIKINKAQPSLLLLLLLLVVVAVVLMEEKEKKKEEEEDGEKGRVISTSVSY